MPKPARGYWIEPRGKSGIWQLCWTEARRKKSRSLGTTDEDDARQYLARFLDELAKPEQPDTPTIASIATAWLDQRSAISTRPAISALKHITKHLGWLTVDELRPSHTKRYIQKRTKEGAKPGTIITELKKMSAALKWAMGEKIITWMPKINYPGSPKPKERWLSREEADHLLACCDKAHHIWLYVQIALHTAARKGAILELTWDRPADSDGGFVDFDKRRIDFGHKEGGKNRTRPPINKTLMPILRQAKEAGQSNYVIEWAGGRVTQIDKGFKRAAIRAGMPEVTPHDLRRTAATWMAMKGVKMRIISEYLGHTSTAITEKVYAKFHPDYLEEAAEALES